MERNNFLNKVYGYKAIKDELYEVRSWYLNKELLSDNEKKEYLPKGILFYGDPGYGKTLLLREFAKSFDYKVFIIEGDSENLDEVLLATYKKARLEKNAIVVIDELDRLVAKDTKLERVLQMELDGFNKEGNVLTLASANDIDNLPYSLLREGRFDRKFNIRITDKNELKEIIFKFLEIRDFKLDDYEIEELTLNLRHEPISLIRTIFNNVYFRYGKNATLENFINEYTFLDSGCIKNNDNFKVDDFVAIHEAGHALYLYKLTRKLDVLRVICNEDGGRTYNANFDSIDDLETRLDNVEVSLAGIVAEELFFNYHSVGADEDLERAYKVSFKLVNRTMINGLNYFSLRDNSYSLDETSEFENKLFAIKTNKFIKKKYRFVKRRLKKYKNEIFLLARYIKENNGITRKEIVKLLG